MKPAFEDQTEDDRTRVSDTKEVGNEFVGLFKMIYAKKTANRKGYDRSLINYYTSWPKSKS